MGRELKRVPLDFTWPLEMIWKGYCSPYTKQKCKACEGEGFNKETLAIYKRDFHTYHIWIASLTQEDIDYLRKETRAFFELTHEWKDGGWIEKDPHVFVDKKMVEKWDDCGWRLAGYGTYLAKSRAQQLGVYGLCPFCKGEGIMYFNEAIRQKSEAWYENERYAPPTGEGYQVWETVSEGSPVSPVFATKEACIDWLVTEGYQRKAAEIFVQEDGWVPSGIMMGDGTFYTNVDCCLVQGGTDDHND